MDPISAMILMELVKEDITATQPQLLSQLMLPPRVPTVRMQFVSSRCTMRSLVTSPVSVERIIYIALVHSIISLSYIFLYKVFVSSGQLTTEIVSWAQARVPPIPELWNSQADTTSFSTTGR